MDREPEGSDEDVQEENRSTVLWEKSFQQSIFVDLSEDESLHFSDLEGSLNLHLSQAESAASEGSIHLSAGSAELSPLDDDTSSECSVIGSQSDRAVEKRSKSSRVQVSAQRPNTTQEDLPNNGDSGQNTSDEDQEDLPFDDDLGCLYFNQTVLSEGSRSSNGRETVHGSPNVLQQSSPLLQQIENKFIKSLEFVEDDDAKPTTLLKEDANSCGASKPNKVPSSNLVDINHVLLRHFSQEELLQSGRLIEAETLPELSLLESVDDTVFSLAQTRKSTAKDSNRSESHTRNSKISQSLCSGVTEEKKNDASKSSSSDEETRSNMDYASVSADSNKSSEDNGDVDGRKADDAGQASVPFVRTKSFSEIKYGQGQVHYPLPDFSKVAPKVKIPKAPSAAARPAPQSPSFIHRTQSSPGMLDVISRVLEDSVLPPEPYVFKHEDKQSSPALVHHLQTEYDKLLTRYAEAENLIDQMRLGTNAHTCSETMLNSNTEDHQVQRNDDDDDDDHKNLVQESSLGSMASHIPLSEGFVEKGTTAPQSDLKQVSRASLIQSEEHPSDGEKMTAELSDIISQFTQKVNEFKLSVSNMLGSTGEQQMMLRSMMEAQDQLERKYRSKKDEHRALEMQNYMGLSRNTGTFDPNRLVEGEIFRIGMHLEDIKEMIEKNVREQISSSNETLQPEPSPLCVSPPPSLHEGPRVIFSAASCEMGTHNKVKGGEEEEKATIVARGDGGLERSSELISSDSLLKHTVWNSCSSWNPTEVSGRSEDGEGTEEEDSSFLSKGLDHSNILAYLSGSGSTSLQRDWTPDSCSFLDGVLNPEEECMSLGVEASKSCATPRDSDAHCPLEPPLSASSRIVSPETDSGFGSSYLNQSGSGPFQPTHLTESGLRSSDSEGSSSNLQTAIHSVSLTSQQWAAVPNQCGGAVAVEGWVEGTAIRPSERLQADKTGSDSIQPTPVHHHVSTPFIRTTMDTGTGHNQSPCSCNSEAILALQSEVSRLKKDLEEGLVQLPHLAQKMDYLTSKYKQGRQERRSKPRPRIHQKSLSNSPAKLDDWISSDMEASKSKVTDSDDTAESEITLQFHSSPAGSSRGRATLESVPHQTLRSHREESMKTYSFTSFSLKRGKEFSDHSDRPQTAFMERWSPLSTASLQKPLLQVNYGSSSSLPASYKVREPPQQPMLDQRKRSTQSDTALLPSDVYFQQTSTRASAPAKTGGRTTRWRGSKDDDVNGTLDRAIEVARSMKRTTDRMAKRLSADLARAQVHRKLHHGKHHAP
ncbi:protein AKNAD1-like isoform X3 [Betta splendens]|uniref:Protein AKNAD1-like isoform X3 n=1 Tax=Betta splendens TaxID=158456 RepID=A0A9W2XD94_BETSP|nr:protein AKNAD1-like isoform X3 [Betta splendens]